MTMAFFTKTPVEMEIFEMFSTYESYSEITITRTFAQQFRSPDYGYSLQGLWHHEISSGNGPAFPPFPFPGILLE